MPALGPGVFSGFSGAGLYSGPWPAGWSATTVAGTAARTSAVSAAAIFVRSFISASCSIHPCGRRSSSLECRNARRRSPSGPNFAGASGLLAAPVPGGRFFGGGRAFRNRGFHGGFARRRFFIAGARVSGVFGMSRVFGMGGLRGLPRGFPAGSSVVGVFVSSGGFLPVRGGGWVLLFVPLAVRVLFIPVAGGVLFGVALGWRRGFRPSRASLIAACRRRSGARWRRSGVIGRRLGAAAGVRL